MKKILIVLAALIAMVVGLKGCNYDMVDTNYHFDYAIIDTKEEVIRVKIKSWTDYDGEQIQITAEDGTVYLTSSFNCTLVKK